MLRIGLYVIGGIVIAFAAFIIGASIEGERIPLVLVAVVLWMAYASYRLRRDKPKAS